VATELASYGQFKNEDAVRRLQEVAEAIALAIGQQFAFSLEHRAPRVTSRRPVMSGDQIDGCAEQFPFGAAGLKQRIGFELLRG